nr:ribonuclease H-like domain-containing protein [Tanacetum cinerariifolium]GEV17070.1 ribonuclease H-like domain-containing protein [Tanacetum cinerariifolium]
MFDCDEMFTSETDESLPASPIYDRYHSGDGYHAVPPPYTGTFMPPKCDLVFHDIPNVNKTDHTAFNVELSPTKPDKDLSHTHRHSGPIIEDWESDSEDDSEAKILQNAPSFVQPTEQVKTPRSFVKTVETAILAANHKTAIPKLKSTSNSRNRKACFVCKSLTHLIKDCDYYDKTVAQTPARNHAKREDHQQYARMTLLNPQRHVVPTASLTMSKLVPITTARLVTAAVSKTHVTRPRSAKTVVTKPHSPPRRNINCSPSPKASNFPPKFTATKASMVNVVKGNWGNPQHALKNKRVINSGCSRHMTGNMSYLSDFKEFNGGYVAFGGNPKGGKIFDKGKIRTGKLDFNDVYFVKEIKFNLFSVSQMCDKKNNVLFADTECIVLSLVFKLPDENQMLLRVLKENNMYNVDLKNIVPSGDLTCLFAKETLDESNLWHKRIPSIGFMRPFGCPVTILNTLDPLGSGPTWLFDIDTLTKTMDYQPVTAGNQSNSNAGVQEQLDAEKAREDNVQQYVLFPVWSSSSKNPWNTNDDAAFGGKKPEFEGRKPESEVHVSSSSKFEDFSDNSINDVNAVDSPVLAVGQISTNSTNTFSVAGPSNAVVSPTHGKSSYMDTSQYLDDPNMPELENITYPDDEEDVATQTRSMTRVAKDQGGLFQINNDDFHTCMFACFLSQEEPKRVHQALKDPSWIEAMQEKLLQYKMQKVWLLVDLPNGKRAIDGKSASTPIDTEKPLLKDLDGEDVDVHTYRSMISSLMYLTSPRPNIMFVVCACARFQVTPKALHLHAVKRNFRYLKGKLDLGLWYPKDPPFNLVAYSDGDYAGASLDRKSTTGVVNSLDAD